jgi:hypothetical protein
MRVFNKYSWGRLLLWAVLTGAFFAPLSCFELTPEVAKARSFWGNWRALVQGDYICPTYVMLWVVGSETVARLVLSAVAGWIVQVVLVGFLQIMRSCFAHAKS